MSLKYNVQDELYRELSEFERKRIIGRYVKLLETINGRTDHAERENFENAALDYKKKFSITQDEVTEYVEERNLAIKAIKALINKRVVMIGGAVFRDGEQVMNEFLEMTIREKIQFLWLIFKISIKNFIQKFKK